MTTTEPKIFITPDYTVNVPFVNSENLIELINKHVLNKFLHRIITNELNKEITAEIYEFFRNQVKRRGFYDWNNRLDVIMKNDLSVSFGISSFGGLNFSISDAFLKCIDEQLCNTRCDKCRVLVFKPAHSQKDCNDILITNMINILEYIRN